MGGSSLNARAAGAGAADAVCADGSAPLTALPANLFAIPGGTALPAGRLCRLSQQPAAAGSTHTLKLHK